MNKNMNTSKAIPPLDAAKSLGHYLEWEVSNLKMNKILYMAQLLYMGKNDGALLIDAAFEAWKYGPVIPEVYHRLKICGRGNVHKWMFIGNHNVEGERAEFLEEMATAFSSMSAYDLVVLTHHLKGAWHKTYFADVRVISEKDIRQEYNELYRQYNL